MARLEDLRRGARVRGVLPEGAVAVVDCKWRGPAGLELLYQDESGRPGKALLYRDAEPSLEILYPVVERDFGANAELFQRVLQAQALRLPADPTPGVSGEEERAAFFSAAIQFLGGQLRPSEPGYYELTRLPPALDGHPLPAILTFSAVKAGPAEWLHPGHPLMQEVAEQVLERYRQVLSQGAVLVDEQAQGTEARLIFFLEQAIEISDGQGGRRAFSRRIQAIEVDAAGRAMPLEGGRRYRSLQEGEEALARSLRAAAWLQGPEAEEKALDCAVAHTVPAHLDQARQDPPAAQAAPPPGGPPQVAGPRPLLLPLPPVVVGVALAVPAAALARSSAPAPPAPAEGRLWEGVVFPSAAPRPPAGLPAPVPPSEDPAPEESGPLFSSIPGLVEERRRGGPAAWQVVAGERMVPVPPELQGEWEAHAGRLRALGLEVPGHLPLVVRNPADGGLAVWIPPGRFTMGSAAGNRDERPARLVDLGGFYLDLCPVTHAQYAAFVAATGYQPRHWKAHQGGRQLAAVNLSWEEARLYAEWAGKRLPTEAEWEKAARGLDGRLYPWGNTFDARRASVLGNDYNRVSPVGQFSAGASPYGMLDMAGNVWEWVADWYGADYYGRSPVQDPRGPERGEHRVLRGGAWICHPRYLRTTQREHQAPSHCSRFIGFRCAQ
jgi:formylglycine-generating enzyme required for sulfatase activity